MLYSTQGIFLQKINYSESSLIAKIYTEKFGLQSYLLKGARNKKKNNLSNLLQHLALLEMEVYYRPSSNLQKIKELRIGYPFRELPYHIRKSTLALFINELLIKVIRQEEASPELFNYLYKAITCLDSTQSPVSNFHLLFMAELTEYLGFSPLGDYSKQTPRFDMAEGIFVSHIPEHVHYMEKEEALVFSAIKNASLISPGAIEIDHSMRHRMLEKIIEYYRLHTPGMDKLKSLSIVKTLFLTS
jgi:DNA repair protein RecO (recombination protein O)